MADSTAKCAVSAAAKRNAICATVAETISGARLWPSSSCRRQHRQLQCRHEDSPVYTCNLYAPGLLTVSQAFSELTITSATGLPTLPAVFLVVIQSKETSLLPLADSMHCLMCLMGLCAEAVMTSCTIVCGQPPQAVPGRPP